MSGATRKLYPTLCAYSHLQNGCDAASLHFHTLSCRANTAQTLHAACANQCHCGDSGTLSLRGAPNRPCSDWPTSLSFARFSVTANSLRRAAAIRFRAAAAESRTRTSSAYYRLFGE